MWRPAAFVAQVCFGEATAPAWSVRNDAAWRRRTFGCDHVATLLDAPTRDVRSRAARRRRVSTCAALALATSPVEERVSWMSSSRVLWLVVAACGRVTTALASGWRLVRPG